MSDQNPWQMPSAGQAPPQYSDAEFVARDGPAWEWRRDLGTWRALWLTFREIVSHPAEAFRRMRLDSPLSAAISYYLLLELVVSFVSYVISLPGQDASRQQLLERMGQLDPSWLSPETLGMVRAQLTKPHTLAGDLVGWVLLYPLGIIFTLFFVSIVTHVFLKILGGARAGFGATLRVTAYSGGACVVFMLVPYLGWLIQGLLWSYVYIIGLTEAHETQTWRSTMAVILPGLIIIVALVVVGAVLLSAALGGAIG